MGGAGVMETSGRLASSPGLSRSSPAARPPYASETVRVCGVQGYQLLCVELSPESCQSPLVQPEQLHFCQLSACS